MYDQQLAEVYDRVYCALSDYAENAELIRDLANRHGDRPTTLLDVGCGTGEHLRHLRKSFTCTGIDLSAPMLEVARTKLDDVPLHEADMRTFDLGRRFDVVCSMYSSIAYLGGLDDLRAAAARLVAHLAPGGVLMVEPWILRERWDGGRLASARFEHSGMVISRMGRWHTREGRSLVDMHYLVSEPHGVRHFVDHQDLALFSQAEYEEAFAAAGCPVRMLEAGRADRGLFLGTMAR
ncbi:methyltransferase domain-containing protein [Micromonospora sp. FIMYZ51]|uniref:class I SAM-dependent DNA methyltransferase n=1 Tax=Micromonospora sp. FIMYZ51 TaxID=3051832 RepID=UPI00311E57F2